MQSDRIAPRTDFDSRCIFGACARIAFSSCVTQAPNRYAEFGQQWTWLSRTS